MENVNPAGANRFPYLSDSSPVVCPFRGSIFASALAAIMITYVTTITTRNNTDVFPRFISTPHLSRLYYSSWLSIPVFLQTETL